MRTMAFVAMGAVLLGVALPVAGQKPAKAAPQAAVRTEKPVKAPRVVVRAQNPLALARPDEVLGLPWVALEKRIPGLDAKQVRALDAKTGKELPVQAIDNDGNGSIDQLLVLADFAPRETRNLVIDPDPPTSPVKARAYARHVDDRDDVAWESDRIAYRIYGQGLWKLENLHSSGIDVWVKRTHDLILDRWYAKGHDAYHKDTGEGADFYTVGESLGAGGDGLWVDGKLYRADNFKSWRVLAAGPIRAVFELTYDPFDAGGRKFTEMRRFTIDAGQHFFQERSVFRAVDGGAGMLTYAIGFVHHAEGQKGYRRPAAGGREWIYTWQPVEKKDAGHGELGLGVLLDRKSIVAVHDTLNHYLAVARGPVAGPLVHFVGAGWTASGDVAGLAGWEKEMDRVAQRTAAPIKLTFADGSLLASAR